MYLICDDYKIKISEDNNLQWIGAVKNYFRIESQKVLSLGKDDSDLKIAMYEILDEVDNILPSQPFFKGIYSGLNFVSEVLFQNRIIDEIEETINIEVLERLKDILAFFDLYGFYVYIKSYETKAFSPEEAGDILRTINKLSPYFEDISLFQPEKKGKIRLPPGLEEEKRKKNGENFYLTKIFKKSVEEGKEILISNI